MNELMFKSKKVTPKLNTYIITVKGDYNDAYGENDET